MSDVIEGYRALREVKREEKEARAAVNVKTLEAYGLIFEVRNAGDVLLFREPGKPKADFYPSTGRWRSGGKTYSGGAHSFRKWYREASPR